MRTLDGDGDVEDEEDGEDHPGEEEGRHERVALEVRAAEHLVQPRARVAREAVESTGREGQRPADAEGRGCEVGVPAEEDEEEDEGGDEGAAVGGREEAQQREDERGERHHEQLHACGTQGRIEGIVS